MFQCAYIAELDVYINWLKGESCETQFAFFNLRTCDISSDVPQMYYKSFLIRK